MFFVVEIQVNANGTAGTVIDTYSDVNTAQNKYHTILAAAAVSQIPKHAAFIFTEDGYIAHDGFEHEVV